MSTTTTISAGTTQTFTASSDGAVFTVVTDGGGDVGYVTDENGRDIPFQGGMRRAFGPLCSGQSIRVYCQIGGVSVISTDVSPSPSTSSGTVGSPVLTKLWGGQLTSATSGGNPFTSHLQTVLEAEFDSVRIGVFNATNSAISGILVSVAAGTALGSNNSAATIDPTANGGTWVDSSVNLLAGVDAFAPSITWTPSIPLASLPRSDGGTLPVIHVRVTHPASTMVTLFTGGTGVGGWESVGNDTTMPFNRPIRGRNQGVDGVTTKGSFTSTGNANAQLTAFMIEYTLRGVVGKTLLVLDNSLGEGAGGAMFRCGWARRLQAMWSTPTSPVEICNSGLSGATNSQLRQRLAAIAPSLVGITATHAPFTNVNDCSTPLTAANITSSRQHYSIVAQLVTQYKLGKLITCTQPPSTYATRAFGAGDPLRIASNTTLLGYPRTVVDFAPSLSASAPDVNGQVNFAAGVSDDGLHPNDTGHAAMAGAYLAPTQW